MHELAALIRNIPDFPKPGIQFKDITTLLKDPDGFMNTVEALAVRCSEHQPDVIVGIEARGFIFGAAVAFELGVGFVPVRKPGKLPGKTRSAIYELEYGTDKLEMHEDAIEPGQRVVIIDDLLATGGTVAAVASLVKNAGGEVAECVFVVELEFLKGREKLPGLPVFSLIQF